jgi:hypothetical protein
MLGSEPPPEVKAKLDTIKQAGSDARDSITDAVTTMGGNVSG